jgi:transposase
MLPAHVRILLCTAPQDFRKSFDGLALITRQMLGEDPQSGTLFAFVNRGLTRLKILWWDRNGYCLLYKRLHGARISAPKLGSSQVKVDLDGAQLAALLRGVEHIRRRRRA